tara:strand:+ start:492 stop:623 length:132 start_codon:yes stop_codon:yes gene_type:complete
MRFLDKIFGSKKVSISKSTEQDIEQAVIIHFNYGLKEWKRFMN